MSILLSWLGSSLVASLLIRFFRRESFFSLEMSDVVFMRQIIFEISSGWIKVTEISDALKRIAEKIVLLPIQKRLRSSIG
ncbi:MAG: hypothetical protein ACLFQS_08865 [Bacteroidales bacterium]